MIPRRLVAASAVLGLWALSAAAAAGAVAAGRRHDQDGMVQELRGERGRRNSTARAELNVPA